MTTTTPTPTRSSAVPALALAVVAVSAGSITAIAAWDLSRTVSANSVDISDGAAHAVRTVELRVVTSEPGVKGDTSGGAQKPATLETGASINVPLFITTGERIKVDTRDGGSYLGRVSS